MIGGLLPDPAQFSIFLTASLLLGLTPGPDMLLVISRAADFGPRAGLITLLGIFLGGMGHVVLASLGISLLVLESPLAYAIVLYAGAAYLVWVAVQIARSEDGITLAHEDRLPSGPTLFRQALLTNALNPKVALFIIAFLPQFVPANSVNAGASMGLLGVIFIGMGNLIMLTLALTFGRFSPWLNARPKVLRAQNLITGGLLIFFAGYLAFS